MKRQHMLRDKTLWALRLGMLVVLCLLFVLGTTSFVVSSLHTARSALADVRLALQFAEMAQASGAFERKKHYARHAINILVPPTHSDYDPNIKTQGSGVGVRRYMIDLLERRSAVWLEKIEIFTAKHAWQSAQRSITFGLSNALIMVNRAMQAGKIVVLTQDQAWAKTRIAAMVQALKRAIGLESQTTFGLEHLVRLLNQAAHIHPLVWHCYPADVWQCLLNHQLVASESAYK